jgi:hypothetical protein
MVGTKHLKEAYKAPLATACGVFLCENVADTVTVSILTGAIDQEEWAADVVLGTGTEPYSDIYFDL